jgi:hypothetical protein
MIKQTEKEIMSDYKEESYSDAPASVTYSITSKDGFNALFTVRDLTGTSLLEKMVAIEQTLIDAGYKPQVKTMLKVKSVPKIWGA